MKRNRHILALILILAAFFRLYGLNWDGGHHLHPDERFLTMVANGIKWPKDFSEYLDTDQSALNPHNAGFDFYVYGTFPVFLVKWVAETLGWGDYNRLTLVGRAISALFDVGTVIMVYLIAKELFGLGRSGGAFFKEFNSNQHQGNGNQHQSGGNLGASHNFPNINSIHKDFLSNLTASNIKNIPKMLDNVKERILSQVKLKDKLGDISTSPNQPADKLAQTAAKTLNQARLSFFTRENFITSNIPLLAAFFYAISVLPIQLSHFFAVDTFLTFFLTLSFYLLVKVIYFNLLDYSFIRLFIYSFIGIAFGLALASKISALLFLPIIGLGFLLAFLTSRLPLIPRLSSGRA